MIWKMLIMDKVRICNEESYDFHTSDFMLLLVSLYALTTSSISFSSFYSSARECLVLFKGICIARRFLIATLITRSPRRVRRLNLLFKFKKMLMELRECLCRSSRVFEMIKGIRGSPLSDLRKSAKSEGSRVRATLRWSKPLLYTLNFDISDF